MSTRKPSDFDDRLDQLLREGDSDYINATIDDPGYYKEAFASLRGPGKGLFILTWIFTIGFAMGLLFCLWKLFGAETVRDQIIFATFAILFNSAQIALKLWFNMRLNRQALMREIKRLQLGLARHAAD